MTGIRGVVAVVVFICLRWFAPLHAQVVVDLGQDYTGSSAVAPVSGVLLVSGTTSYAIGGENRTAFSGYNVTSKYDDGSYGAKGTKFNYLQVNAGGYVEIALTEVSRGFRIKEIKINGTSGSTTVLVSSLPVLFSDRYPFDESRIIGYSATGSLPYARAGGAGFSINEVPEGCKSLRIYRNVALRSVGSGLYGIDMDGGTTVLGQTAQTPRLAYLKVVLEEEPLHIKSFVVNGYAAEINQEERSISLVLPSGSDLTQLTPELVLSGTATHYAPTGEQDFSSQALVYTVYDATTSVSYTTRIEASVYEDSVNTVATATINGRTAVINEEEQRIECEFPGFFAPLGSWPVRFSLDSELSTADFVSGETHDFATGPLLLTVRAQDGGERVYTVNARISEKSKTLALLTSNGQLASYDGLLCAAFDAFFVDVLRSETVAPGDMEGYFEPYDLIVLHSNISNSNATAKAIRTLVGKKPILNLNASLYASTCWSWGTPANAGPYSNGNYDVFVSTSLQGHPIFENIVFETEAHATLRSALKYYSQVERVTANNSIQCLSDLNGSNFSTLKSASRVLAAIEGMYGEADQIHELLLPDAAGYLFIGLSYQGDSYLYFGSNTMELLRNAADYLTK